jgi:DNA repair photolyase
MVYMEDAMPIEAHSRKYRVGPSRIEYKSSRSILSKATGFADSYDFTLNPYSGCSFGCNYCYAAFFVKENELKEAWGKWVQVKENALDLLKKHRGQPLIGERIYMSSVTDPYQPIEKTLGLTRAILEELLTFHRPQLVIQTRSPLVVRDIDLLRRFEHVQVNMTITTDDDAIRMQFEPDCPSIDQRLEAITRIALAGIQTCITMTPLLPLKSPYEFAKRLRNTGVHRFVAQAFHPTKSRFAAGTGETAQAIAQEMQWTPQQYQETFTILSAVLPNLYEGKAGFRPEWSPQPDALVG